MFSPAFQDCKTCKDRGCLTPLSKELWCLVFELCDLRLLPTYWYLILRFVFSSAGYTSTPAASAQGYSQPSQGYGANSYDSAPPTTPTSQTSYGAQQGYGAQSAYAGYGQQATSAAPPR